MTAHRPFIRILFIALLPSFLFAQKRNLFTELAKMKSYFRHADSWSMDVSVCMYKEKNAKTPTACFKGVSRKQENCFYTEMMGQITLINLSGSYFIDRNSRLIIAGENKQSNKTSGENEPAYFYNSDSVSRSTVKIIAVSSNAGSTRYTLTPINETEYDSLHIVMDDTTSLLREVNYFLKKADKQDCKWVRVQYANILFNEKIAPGIFSENRFLRKTKNGIQPTGICEGYRLIPARP